MLSIRYRWAVASRCIAAFGGGYLVTALVTVLLANLLPLPARDAGLLATIVSFALYVVVVIWAIAASSLRRVWIGIVSMSALLAVARYMLDSGVGV